MSKLSKYMRAVAEKVTPGQVYSASDALKLLKEVSKRKFQETVEVSIRLGIDPRKSDQAVRGATVLPNGTGRTVRVAVFAQGANATAAKEAGADIVGFEDLAETIKSGKIEFDILIATPDAMRLVGQLGQILGPRGLMPNPKVGTVTPNVAAAVKNMKSGQVAYRSEKAGIVHAIIGKINFTEEQLKQNLKALIADIKKLKPASSKGTFIKKISLSSTMGPGLTIDITSLDE